MRLARVFGTCVWHVRLARTGGIRVWADHVTYICPYMALSGTNSLTLKNLLTNSLTHAHSSGISRSINAIALTKKINIHKGSNEINELFFLLVVNNKIFSRLRWMRSHRAALSNPDENENKKKRVLNKNSPLTFCGFPAAMSTGMGTKQLNNLRA